MLSVVLGLLVRDRGRARVWLDVDGRAVEVSDVVKECVLDVVGYGMRVRDREIGIDVDGEVGPQAVAFPANLGLADAEHATSPGGVTFDPIHERRVDAVHQPAQHVRRGRAEHCKDRDRDDEPGDGVGGIESSPDPDGTENDRE